MKLINNIQKRLANISFGWRIRYGIILVIFVVTVLSVSVFTYREGQHVLQTIDEMGRYMALNLSKNCVLGILSQEPTNLDQPLQATLSDKQVLGAAVYLASGKLIKSMQQEQYLLRDLNQEKQLALVTSALEDVIIRKTSTYSGKRIRSYLSKVFIEKLDDVIAAESPAHQFSGFVRVDISLDDFFAEKTAVLWQNLLLMPFYIGVGLLVSLKAEKHISKPLRDLKAAAVAMANGDFSRKIQLGAQDEIGALAQTFNQMSMKLSQTIRELNLSNQQLEKANKELEDFTYVVSHDLQEPLRKVHSFGEFLLEDYGSQIPGDGKDYIIRMQRASIKMKKLIEDLLKLSRVGTIETLFRRVNTNEVVNSALEDLSEAIRETNAEIIVGKLPDVLGQDTLLVQLFGNLIANAIKYRRDNVRPRVEIKATENNDRVTFSIEDNGVGIREQFLERIFGVFQRLHNDKKYKGTGIGLALCKKIAQRHRGEIAVQSTPGKGSIFNITLEKYKG